METDCMKRALILDYDDYENFVAHPISAFDPHYTKDSDSWRRAFDEFLHFTRELILSNPSRKNLNYITGIYADTLYSIKAYERHAGVNLFPTRFWGRSMLHSLFSGDTLTPV